MTETVDTDVMNAWSLALGLEDAPPERVAAVVAVLARSRDGDVARMAAAAEVYRSRAAAEEDFADIHERAAEILDAAAYLTANPQPEVEADDDRLDLGPSLRPIGLAAWWRRLRARRVRYAYSDVGRFHRIGLRLGGRETGKVMYEVCAACRYGLLGKISIEYSWQRAGVGHSVISHMVVAHPGLAWYTTVQMPGSEHFWTRMATDTKSPFTFSTGCSHMRREQNPPAEPLLK